MVDCAYAIESFLVPPHDNTASISYKDELNFFQSSARITVKYAFGEIDLRWGNFRKMLAKN